MKLHLIWDLDGTLVNSEPEILTTIQKALATIGLSVEAAKTPLRIGPPLPIMLRTSFDKDILSDCQLDEVIKAFRQIYDASDFEETCPFDGIDELIHSTNYIHYVITNKPFLATSRIIEKKGWKNSIVEILTPDALVEKFGRSLTKAELFQYFHSSNPDVCAVGIGDMEKDAECAKAIGIPAIGVLWGTGTKEELLQAGCDDIVKDYTELRESLKKYC